MSNPAQNAFDKIVKAFGIRLKERSQIKFLAQIARLHNDIEEKRIYPELPEAQRDAVADFVKKYFLYYGAQHHMLKQPAYLFYPKALSYWAFKKVSWGGINPDKILAQSERAIRKAHRAGIYPEIFNQCVQEITENPEHYPSKTLHELMLKASYASLIGIPILRNIFRQITGYGRHETQLLLHTLSNISHVIDAEIVSSAIKKTYTPEIGPDTPEELLFTCSILYNYFIYSPYARTESYAQACQAMVDLLTFANNLCADIPEQNLQNYGRVLGPHTFRALHSHQIDPGQTLSIAVAMGRYYLEQHRDKLSTSQATQLSEMLAELYIHSFTIDDEKRSKVGIAKHTDSEKGKLINRMFNETWASWPKPSLDELIENLDNRLKGKNKLRFYNILDEADPYFDVHISYYTEQSESVRRLRRNLFKNGSIGGENEPFRELFVHSLATCHQDKLAEAGFSDTDIRYMDRARRIPENPANGQKWTVDHIVDLHAGGTNQLNNFCLMPESLNKLKNDFLLLQTGLKSNAKTGYWVLVLRPKTGLDGQPLIILPTSKPTNGLGQSAEQNPAPK